MRSTRQSFRSLPPCSTLACPVTVKVTLCRPGIPTLLPAPYDTAELAAGCALSEGFRLLHYQLTGLPTTLRALRGWDQRGKVAAIVAPTAAARVALVMRKLTLVPPFLAEWQTSPSLPTAQLLCAQARHLFADVPFTRQFLRTQSRVFHDAAENRGRCREVRVMTGAAERQRCERSSLYFSNCLIFAELEITRS
jgi:hypothetical protein